MKPHEETWVLELHGNACECPSVVRVGGPDKAVPDDATLFYANDGGRAGHVGARMQLAACAPEMARMLLRFAEHGVDLDGDAVHKVLHKAGVLE
jgi:hypothetical protein